MLERRGGLPLPLVVPLARKAVEDVGRRHDSGLERDRRASEPVGVAAAVGELIAVEEQPGVGRADAQFDDAAGVDAAARRQRPDVVDRDRLRPGYVEDALDDHGGDHRQHIDACQEGLAPLLHADPEPLLLGGREPGAGPDYEGKLGEPRGEGPLASVTP